MSDCIHLGVLPTNMCTCDDIWHLGSTQFADEICAPLTDPKRSLGKTHVLSREFGNGSRCPDMRLCIWADLLALGSGANTVACRINLLKRSAESVCAFIPIEAAYPYVIWMCIYRSRQSSFRAYWRLIRLSADAISAHWATF